MAKGMFADVVRYKHNDMADLERVISRLPAEAAKLVVTDGVFSTSGEIVDLPHLVAIAKKHNARILVDDAHAVGVIGKGGRGTAKPFRPHRSGRHGDGNVQQDIRISRRIRRRRGADDQFPQTPITGAYFQRKPHAGIRRGCISRPGYSRKRAREDRQAPPEREQDAKQLQEVGVPGH